MDAAYPPKNPPLLPYEDNHSPHRMTIAARRPTGATAKMESLFKDFPIAADGPDQDEKDKNGESHDCVSREDKDKTKLADLLILRLKPTYEKPFGNRPVSLPRRVRNVRSAAEDDVDMASVNATTAAVLARKVGDTYSPDLLADHKGDYFAHDKVKLVQRPYKDENGHLIAPHELYSKLVEETLFSAKISLSMYIMKDRNPRFLYSKIYHINVEKLTILDPGYGPAWTPAIPTLPTNAPSTPKTKRARERDAAVDDAFDNLSPSKISRSA
ncbi:hypothetical protein B0H10DRAFT_1964510 [Mycena sp. CBHHK59/15]|nr:hypothetical protein B0H10DRAFT_1964510 [Mycena sp. CBHHK59/15]